jgi:hypothetical protein
MYTSQAGGKCRPCVTDSVTDLRSRVGPVWSHSGKGTGSALSFDRTHASWNLDPRGVFGLALGVHCARVTSVQYYVSSDIVFSIFI